MAFRIHTPNGTIEKAELPSDEELLAMGYTSVQPFEPVSPVRASDVLEEISEAFSNEYSKLWSGLGYESAWEVEAYANTPGHKYQPEAQAVRQWRIDTWDFIESAEITAATNVQTFINSLPPFTY